MYSPKDMQEARCSLNRCCGLLASVLVPLLAIYGLGIVKGLQGLMLAALLAGFAWTVLFGDLKLMPALRYVRFLQEMESGLRHSTDCTLETLESEAQVQDGVRVFALHVRLIGDGDSRILYVNASKAAMLPVMGSRVKITSYGRHVVDCEAV